MLMKRQRFNKWLALSVPLCFATYVCAQSAPSQNPTRNNDTDVTAPAPDRDINHGDLWRFDRFLDEHQEIAEQLRKDPSLANNKKFLKDHPALQTYLRQNPDIHDALRDNPNAFMNAEGRFDRNEAYRGGLASFDRFLDAHRDIASQLRKNPSLVDNQQYLKDHPELQSYLQNHPEVRQEIDRNPNGFMQRENSYDRYEERGELAKFDRFLDSHREIAIQLQKDPSLLDNQQYLKDHPQLQTYLQDHPEVRQEIDRNPTAFMQQENGYERSEDSRNRDRELASFDQFLDSHREISEQLRKQPSLADNKQFLNDHPALQSYLQQHPEVRQQLTQNPNAFMSEEARYERTGDDRNMDRYASQDRDRNNSAYGPDRDRSNGMGQHDRDRDLDRDAHRHFGEFLGSHQDIAEQLSRNPSLAKDHDYLQDHPELQEYLNAHPEVRQPLTSDPDSFVKSAQQFNGQSGQPTKMPTPGSTQSKPKP